MIVRAESLSKSMSHYLSERIATIPNINVIAKAEVKEVRGDGRLQEIDVYRHDTKETETLPAGALFIFIGAEPHTDWLEGVVCRDRHGFLATGPSLMTDGRPPANWPVSRAPYLFETSIPGVFAIGDVRDTAIRRVANSVGEGSVVLYFIRQYMRNR
jgi:thioredoxin reductase (NADPH)